MTAATAPGPVERRFSQVDVFTTGPLTGNPVAVVHDADDLDEPTLQAFARWTNLSETTFLLTPSAEGVAAGADYRVRIFTPDRELPFAGHPTLGSAHAWLEAGGRPRTDGVVVQECGAGPVVVRRGEATLAFAAPGFLRYGEVDAETREWATRALRLFPEQVLDAHWLDNGPGWLGLRLVSADAVLAVRPDPVALAGRDVGVIGLHEPGGPADAEVRAFAGDLGVTEDPVTGSLNAGFGVWLVETGVLPPAYTARQGTALGRDGRVHVVAEDAPDGSGRTTWVGGATRTVVAGTVAL